LGEPPKKDFIRAAAEVQKLRAGILAILVRALVEFTKVVGALADFRYWSSHCQSRLQGQAAA
jgi:hypothetical protein